MPESNQHKLDRVRKPRVHITYDVEIGDAVVKKELPFVMGVLGDFSGNPTEPLKKLTERKFASIDRDNFNDVMASMTPGLNMRVENTLAGDGSEMAVNLEFKSMDDFDPGKVVEQVAPLKKMQEARDQLRDLLTNMDKSEDLEAELEAILKNTEKATELAGEMGLGADSGSDNEGGEE
ncbi:MAG: type VI secretion system contractile sheath small subunit [Planctomycetaceae bacterium]